MSRRIKEKGVLKVQNAFVTNNLLYVNFEIIQLILLLFMMLKNLLPQVKGHLYHFFTVRLVLLS